MHTEKHSGKRSEKLSEKLSELLLAGLTDCSVRLRPAGTYVERQHGNSVSDHSSLLPYLQNDLAAFSASDENRDIARDPGASGEPGHDL